MWRVKKLFLILLLAPLFCEVTGQDKTVMDELILHREEVHRKFKDKTLTPLDKKDLRKFKGLNYYPVDLNYRFKVRFVLNDNPVLFKMTTTTNRLPDYVKYGDVFFFLGDREYKLEVYQSPEIIRRPGYEDYLFIPFTDETNGAETYDIGRYLEMRIPAPGEDIYIDFNKSYNPYCSYSNRYSCPIPPRQNHLPVTIPVGEKKFRESDH